MTVAVVANSREALDLGCRQWYQRELDTLTALGLDARLDNALSPFWLPDLYVSWWAARSAPAVLWSRLLGRACVVVAGGADTIPECPTLPGHPFFYNAKPWWVRLLIRFALRRADAVIAVSEATRAGLERLGARRIFVVPNCVDTDLFQPRLEDQQPGHIVTVCNMHPDACVLKDLPTVLEAFGETRRQFPAARLTVVGTHAGGFRAMQDLACRLGVGDAVEFPGRLPNRGFARVLQTATAFLTATRYETCGVAVAEALASGVPVVAPDLPAIREVAGDTYPLVLNPGAADFSSALCRLLGDTDYRRALGLAGRERICSRYTIQARAKAMGAVTTALFRPES